MKFSEAKIFLLFKPIILLFLFAVVMQLSTLPLFSRPSEEQIEMFRQRHVANQRPSSEEVPVFKHVAEPSDDDSDKANVDSLVDSLVRSVLIVLLEKMAEISGGPPSGGNMMALDGEDNSGGGARQNGIEKYYADHERVGVSHDSGYSEFGPNELELNEKDLERQEEMILDSDHADERLPGDNND